MRVCVLIRHASAAAAAPGGDLDRPLTAHGVQEAQAQGEWLETHGFDSDRVLCSPARRTRDTAAAMGLTVSRVMDAIYEATPGELLLLLESHADADILTVVGHNPGLSGLARFLSGERIDLRPGSVVALRFAEPVRGAPRPGSARVRLFRHPGAVDGPDAAK